MCRFRSLMTPPHDIQVAQDHLEGVLEASCATLVALQAINSRVCNMPRDDVAVETQIAEAIKSLRKAITELRRLHDSDTSILAFGFVLGAGPGWSRAQGAGN